MARSLRLYLVRHGEVAANRDFKYVGTTDEELTSRGREQAEALGSALAALRPDRILTSPLQRARSTAQAIGEAADLVPEVDVRLREQSFGEWEGKTRAEVKELGGRHPAVLAAFDQDSTTAPPGGESATAVAARTSQLASELLEEGDSERVVLVSHVGPIKSLLAACLDVTPKSSRRFFLDPASISVIDWSPRRLLRLFNSHAHLGWHQPRWLELD